MTNNACPEICPTNAEFTEGEAPVPAAGSDLAMNRKYAVGMLRRCRRCGEDKRLKEFSRQMGTQRRFRPDCKVCCAEVTRERRRELKVERPPETILCTRCEESRPVADFVIDTRCRDGRSVLCKACRKVRRARKPPVRGGLRVPDELIPEKTKLHEDRIDLGIAIAHATTRPGECRTREEIAAYAGVSVEAIRKIEVDALEKIRVRAESILAVRGLAFPEKKGGAK